MTDGTIDDTGNLPNLVPVEGSANPHECHMFNNQLKYTKSADFLKHVSWELTLDVPVGVTIDNAGLISGEVAPFWLQPSATEIPFALLSDYLLATNQVVAVVDDLGTHTINSSADIDTLIADYLVTPPAVPKIEVRLKVTSDIDINVIKDNSLDLRYYILKYTEAGYYVMLDGNKYDNSNVNDFLNTAPGPFGYCTVS